MSEVLMARLRALLAVFIRLFKLLECGLNKVSSRVVPTTSSV